MKTESKTLTNFYRTLILLCKDPKKNANGYMLFLVVSLAITLSGLLVAYAVLAKISGMSTRATATGNSGFFGAEGALNIRAEQLRRVLQEGSPFGTSPTSVEDCLSGSNVGSGDYACKTRTFSAPNDSTAKIVAHTYVVAENNGESIQGIVPPGETFQGLNMLENRYTVNAITTKENSDEVIAITELGLKSRQIPLFQFAVFYTNDLEILPGGRMNLAGPVHTNSSLFLGGSMDPPNGLSITAQVTVGQNLFNHRKNDNSTYPNGRVRIANGAGTFVNLLEGGRGNTTETTAAMIPANVTASWGSQVQLGVEALSIPTISTLGVGGNYHEQADVRFFYVPEKPSVAGFGIIPFTVTATKRNSSGVGTPDVLSNAQLASLRQPVLAFGNAVTAGVCTPVAQPDTTNLTVTQISDLPGALQRAILSQTTPVPFSAIGVTLNSSPLNSTGGVRDAVETNLAPLTTAQRDQIRSFTPNQIAALAGGCFVSAPIQHPNTTGYTNGVRFINNRERSPGNNFRRMQLLQINLESLTVWNFQGVFLNGTTLTSANQVLFATAAADNTAPLNSFQQLGLAGSDTSRNGLVFYATVSGAATPNPITNASPYGFAIVRGQQLPGLAETTNNSDPTGLTFVSDQAVDLVGNYNSLSPQTWQPASILADSLNVLSGRCINDNVQIFKGDGRGCGSGDPMALNTIVNTAFLSGTDITNSTLTPGYNGGLENYPRYHENWGGSTGSTLTYRGSFVSTGLPERVTGPWSDQLYAGPNRDWAYDARFNQARNLPPMSPHFVFLKQESFTRNFDR
ncbi:hypothetical protein IQ225_08680 [Synechocystis salina LEGE 06155]|nr:hypothetical protein [Synechocystis salina LEGE 06155]